MLPPMFPVYLYKLKQTNPKKKDRVSSHVSVSALYVHQVE